VHGETLPPTALVHEAFIRLLGKDEGGYENRRHFFFAAARAMQDIMLEQARRKARRARLGAKGAVESEPETEAEIAAPPKVLALSQALQLLQEADPRKADLVRLRFFAGLTMSQASRVMGVSEPTLKRDWRAARSMLFVQLKHGGPDE
jgi:RNA polymerase sigma factor (TIGR02999 family)